MAQRILSKEVICNVEGTRVIRYTDGSKLYRDEFLDEVDEELTELLMGD